MKLKYISPVILIVIIMLGVCEIDAKGVDAGTRITNTAEVEYTWGAFSTNTSVFMSTQVMAIYGMTPVTGQTDSSTYPGGLVSFDYFFTNNGNTVVDYILTLSNFTMTNGYSGDDWVGWLSLNTARTIAGTNAQSIYITNTLNIDAVSSFTLFIQTAGNSSTYDWGFIPMVVQVTASGLAAGYTGDNSIFYGGTNYRLLRPKVTINAPYITLRKALSISNTPVYLANGGLPNIPVPDSVITYTNYYDNDGNSRATNLEIRDRIPYHTDFIWGSIDTTSLHTTGSASIQYYTRTGSPYTVTGFETVGSPVPAIGEIRFLFGGGTSVAAHNSDALDNPDAADGNIPDTDAGRVIYKVLLHKRD